MSLSTVLSDNGKMRLEMEKSPQFLLFRPVGVVDEDTNFSVILSAVTQPGYSISEVRFDLSRVTRLNSCGVREWLLLIERVGAKVPMKFYNVCELFIQQANVMPGIFGRKFKSVVSFEAPYRCPNCRQEVVKWLEPGQVKFADGKPMPPVAHCDRCGKPLAFDWDEEEYFGFLKSI